ncbi:MAG: class I SAM-dependent methyltransferase [Thaumarchaeota archaeon]|nr:class I SAM-dependent methyltransferase [Nitrososphaerota archaeon]
MSGKFVNRFSGKGEMYFKYRPGYPKKEILEILNAEIDFDRSRIVADVGSGTGLLSRVFLENGNKVFGVEPNDEMRSFGETDLSGFDNFVSVKGTAENTGLADHSVDLVVAGQALHWFDREASRSEFMRILNNGCVLIAYNERRKEKKTAMEDYENMTSKHTKKTEVPDIDDDFLSKFFKSSYKKFTVRNEQSLDLEGLLGRAGSASYLPSEGQEGFEAMKQDLQILFNTHQKEGQITLEYATVLYLGQIKS